MRNKRAKRKTKYEFNLAEGGKITAHGGQIAVDALARRFNIWQKMATSPVLDWRKRKASGFTPEAIFSQVVFALTSGGTTLADCERLGADPVLLEAVGLPGAADQTTVGEWLRAIPEEGVKRLWAINSEFVADVLAEARPDRVLTGGKLEVFFDDTEIEVEGKKIEGAKVNYNGDLALSFQTIWAGPFLLDGMLEGGCAGVASCQTKLLAAHRGVWEGGRSHFFADSGSSAGKSLVEIRGGGFTTWSVSYNKWTSALERLAAELPEDRWGEELERAPGHVETYAWVMHTPGEMDRAQTFSACRWKKDGEMFWRYAFTACEDGAGRTPGQVFAMHRTKGDRERLFSDVLSTLDLHHPPCLSLGANQAFYALAAIAHNLLVALKVLQLADAEQTWRIKTTIRALLNIPAQQVAHANRKTLRLCVPAGWLKWWRIFIDTQIPRRKRGESADEAYSRQAPPA